jgi:hypothetical protein
MLKSWPKKRTTLIGLTFTLALLTIRAREATLPELVAAADCLDVSLKHTTRARAETLLVVQVAALNCPAATLKNWLKRKTTLTGLIFTLVLPTTRAREETPAELVAAANCPDVTQRHTTRAREAMLLVPEELEAWPSCSDVTQRHTTRAREAMLPVPEELEASLNCSDATLKHTTRAREATLQVLVDVASYPAVTPRSWPKPKTMPTGPTFTLATTKRQQALAGSWTVLEKEEFV